MTLRTKASSIRAPSIFYARVNLSRSGATSVKNAPNTNNYLFGHFPQNLDQFSVNSKKFPVSVLGNFRTDLAELRASISTYEAKTRLYWENSLLIPYRAGKSNTRPVRSRLRRAPVFYPYYDNDWCFALGS